jgi:hypothetical protein
VWLCWGFFIKIYGSFRIGDDDNMLADIVTTDVLWKILCDSIQPLIPIILPIVIGGFVVIIIKLFIRNVVYDLSRISGNSKRIAKRDAKKAEKIVDLVTAVNDIRNIKK